MPLAFLEIQIVVLPYLTPMDPWSKLALLFPLTRSQGMQATYSSAPHLRVMSVMFRVSLIGNSRTLLARRTMLIIVKLP